MPDRYASLPTLAQQAAKTMGPMRRRPPSQAIAVFTYPEGLCLQLVDLNTSEPLWGVGVAANRALSDDDFVEALTELLSYSEERDLEQFAFKLELLESGRWHWVHWNIRQQGRNMLCGRNIQSEPV